MGERINKRQGRISGTYREDGCVQGLCSKQGAHALIFSYSANHSVTPVDEHRGESSNISPVSSPRSFRSLVESPTPRVLPWGALNAVFRHRISGWTSDQFFDIGSVVRCRVVPWCHFVARCQSPVKRCTISARVWFFCWRNRASSAFWTKAFQVQGAGIGEFCFLGVRSKIVEMLALLWCG